MKVVIFGATGRSGRAVLVEALERGHVVTALVRSPESLNVDHANLRIIQGDVLDALSVEEAVKGQDAAISLLGAGIKRSTLRTEGNRQIIQAMEKTGVRRLISQSIFGLGDSAKALPLYWKLLVKALILRNAYKDHAGQEAVIKASNLDWTITRPVSLRDWEPTGEYQHGSSEDMEKITLKIAVADLVRFTLDQLTSDAYVRKTPGISYVEEVEATPVPLPEPAPEPAAA